MDTLDERVATAVISSVENKSDVKIKPSFDAISYFKQRKQAGRDDSIQVSIIPGPSSTDERADTRSTTRINPWTELKAKNRLLDNVCRLVSNVSGQMVDQLSVVRILEQYIQDPNQSTRQYHHSRVWGEAEERIDTIKNKSQIEKVQLELELIKEREKGRNLSSILIQKELEAKCDQLEKRNLKLVAKVKSMQATISTKKQSKEGSTQTVIETAVLPLPSSPATGKLLAKKDELIMKLKNEVDIGAVDVQRLNTDLIHYERVVDELENERKRRKRFMDRAELAEAKLEQLMNSHEFQLMQNFGNYLSTIT